MSEPRTQAGREYRDTLMTAYRNTLAFEDRLHVKAGERPGDAARTETVIGAYQEIVERAIIAIEAEARRATEVRLREQNDGLYAAVQMGQREQKRLREAANEAAEWLESRPDMTEGDAATASTLRAALASTEGPRDATR